MDIVTLGAALNGSAEYVNSHFKGGSNIQIVDNPDGTQTINASGEVSAEDTVARADIAAIKDGETLDSFGDVETALATKANASSTYTKTEVDTALGGKVDKETGKGLSTNDYTTAEKTKLAGIAEGAEVNEIQGIKVNSSTVNPDVNKVVNITVPTTAADVSALPDTTKYAAALSLTINSSTFVMTGQLKDQNGDNLGAAQTIDLPLESVVVGGSYNSQTQKVVLTLQNGNTIEFSVADLVSGLQTELSTSNKLNPAFIEYDSTHRAVSDTEKSTWNSKQNALSSTQLDAVNSGIDSEKVEQIETNKNNISTIDNAIFSKNLFNINTFYENAERSSSTGEIISNNAGYGVSDVILIDNSKAIYFTYNGEPFTPTFIYIYNNAGNFVQRTAGSNPYIPTQYHGAISVCFPNAKAPLFQMEYGSATAYEPYKNIDNFEDFEIMADVNMFGSIAGVGDSYTAGYSASKTGSAQDMPNQSYIATIGKRAGVDWYNYGVTGATAKTYTTNADGLLKILSDSARDLYIINLGQNDINVGSTVGTTADIHDDWTLNPDTFCGNMGKIIAQIRNHAPKSKIILVKSWLNTKKWGTDISYQSLDDTIQSIADYYHIPCISPYDDCFFYSRVFQSYRVQGHPTTMGYAMMGIAMERLLSKCIVTNPAYFQYATIG